VIVSGELNTWVSGTSRTLAPDDNGAASMILADNPVEAECTSQQVTSMLLSVGLINTTYCPPTDGSSALNSTAASRITPPTFGDEEELVIAAAGAEVCDMTGNETGRVDNAEPAEVDDAFSEATGTLTASPSSSAAQPTNTTASTTRPQHSLKYCAPP
jgi:hypothetical protein